MTMKNLAIVIIIVSTGALLAGCGGGSKNQEIKSDTSEVVVDCRKECTISLQVNKLDLPDGAVFKTDGEKFQVSSSEFRLINDSVAEFRLSNYPENEKNGQGLSENQIDIMFTLKAQHGKLLQPGEYKYMDFESDFFAKVNVVTAKGTIWFNWVSGMPKQGAVSIYQIDRNSICGSVKLNVEKPENRTIGIVKLNGNFFIE